MTGDHQPVAGVGGFGRVDLGLQSRSDGLVVIPESGVALASSAQGAAVHHGGLKVGKPVAQGTATTERQHDQLVGVVGGQEAGGITVGVGAGWCQYLSTDIAVNNSVKNHSLVKLVQQLGAVSLHGRAVARGAGNGGVGAIGVVTTVCGPRPLSIDIQRVENSGGDV